MKASAQLVPIQDRDFPFLRHLYGDTRREELEPTGWTDNQKKEFLDMQFHAQHCYYKEQYPQASFDLIVKDETPIGRLYIHRGSEEMRIIDIALLETERQKGIGSELLQGLILESERDHKILSIHVEKNNPALHLYLRLGFKKKRETGIYDYMERLPKMEGIIPCD